MDIIQADLIFMAGIIQTGIIQTGIIIIGITGINKLQSNGQKVRRKLMKPGVLFLEKIANKVPLRRDFLFDITQNFQHALRCLFLCIQPFY